MRVRYPAAGAADRGLQHSQPAHQPLRQALTFDANGNLTSDGPRTYAWDAENRLVGITYPGNPGKATAFTYDGLGRRGSADPAPSKQGAHPNNTATTIKVAVLLPVAVLQVCHTVQHRHFRGGGGVVV